MAVLQGAWQVGCCGLWLCITSGSDFSSPSPSFPVCAMEDDAYSSALLWEVGKMREFKALAEEAYRKPSSFCCCGLSSKTVFGVAPLGLARLHS